MYSLDYGGGHGHAKVVFGVARKFNYTVARGRDIRKKKSDKPDISALRKALGSTDATKIARIKLLKSSAQLPECLTGHVIKGVYRTLSVVFV